jgi:hypothetical protein
MGLRDSVKPARVVNERLIRGMEFIGLCGPVPSKGGDPESKPEDPRVAAEAEGRVET